MRDMYNQIGIKLVIPPVVVSDNTPQVGAIIDRSGFEALTYLIATGTLADADATFSVSLHEGDEADLSDAALVSSWDLLGSNVPATPTMSFTFANDGVTMKLGYIGARRYTRLTITPSGNSGSAPIAAVAILGRPNTAPVA